MMHIITGRVATLKRRMGARQIVLAIALTLASALWIILAVAPQAQARLDCANHVCSTSPAGTVGWRTPKVSNHDATFVSTADASGALSGAGTVITIANAAAPSSYTFPLDLPRGSTAAVQADGSVLVSDADRPLGSFRPPWAKDATGRPLPTHYVLTGGPSSGYALTQRVSTAGARFPVTADPHYTWGWVTGTIYFNKRETKILANGIGAAAFLATLAGPWGRLIQGILFPVELKARWAILFGDCVDVKSTGTINIYGGKQGDGYCK